MTLVDDGRVETGGLSFLLTPSPCLLQNPDILFSGQNLSHTDEQTCKTLATYLMRDFKSLGLMTKMMSPTLTPSVAVSNRAQTIKLEPSKRESRFHTFLTLLSWVSY